MTVERLPASTQALMSELLDHMVGADAVAALSQPVTGSFVCKTVKGRVYWYLQRAEGERTRQHYLGPDSAELRRWMDGIAAARATAAPDEAEHRRLCAMLVAGGALGEAAATLRVVELLAEAGVFRLGGVLVGTLAFRALGNLLAVRLAGSHLRTDDVDVAQEPGVAVAVDPATAPRDLPTALGTVEPPFLPVPGLDSRSPSTTFKVRGRELRVDFLCPGAWRNNGAPIPLPAFGCAAQPLPFLGYLIEGAIPGVLLGARPVLVSVPRPARLALHKLFTAAVRSPTFHTKALKDLRQAATLLEVLLDERPVDLEEAWAELDRHRRARAKVIASTARLEPALQERLAAATRRPAFSRQV